MRVELILEAIDRATGPIRAVQRAMKGINNVAAEHATVEKVQAAQQRASQAQASAQSELMGAVGTAAAVAAPITKSVKQWNEYEDVLTDIGIKADVSGAKLMELGNRVRAQSRAVNTSSTDMLKGFDQLMAGGLSVDVAEKITGPLARATVATKSKFEDLAKSAVSLVNNLKVVPAEVSRTLDVMNQTGKDGQFEMKDMARYFPMLGAQYQGMGQKGVKAVADIASMLQIVRGQTGTAESAAKALEDLLNKNTLGPAKKKFEELGVDITKMMENAEKSGTVIETLHEALQKATGGNAGKLKEIFGDKQALTAARALMQNYQDFLKIRERALVASGSVDKDFATRMGLGVEKMREMSNAGTELGITLGQIFAPTVTAMVQAITDALWQLNEWAKANPEMALSIAKVATAIAGLLVVMAALTFAKAIFGNGLKTLIGLLWKVNAAGKNVGILAIAFRLLGGAVRLVLAPFGILARFLIGFGQGAAAAIASFGGLRVVLMALGRGLLSLVLSPLALLRNAVMAMAPAFMAMGAAIMATPIGWIIAGVVALAAGAYLIYRNWDKIGPWFSALWEGIKTTIANAWEAISSTIAGWGDGILAKIKGSWEAVKGWFAGLEWPKLPDIGALFEGFDPLAKIKTTLEPVLKFVGEWGGKLSGVFETVFGKISGFVGGAIDKISAGFAKIGDIVSSVGDWVSGAPKVIDPVKMQAGIDKAREYETQIKAIGPSAQQAVNQASAVLAAANFHSHGVRMMTTLAQGIRDGSNSAVEAVRDTVKKMRDYLPHSPAKVGPLSDLDKVQFAQTLAGAIERGSPRALAAARTLAAGLAASIPTGETAFAGPAKPAIARPIGGAAAGKGGTGSVTVNLTLSPNFQGGDAGDFLEKLKAALPDIAYELGQAIQTETGRRERTEF